MPKNSAASTFDCDICSKPVQIAEGLVQHRPMPNDHKVAAAKWAEKHPGPALSLQDLMNGPLEPPLWQLGHLKCFEDIDEDYWFSLDRCSTPGQALNWTAHLGHKVWFDASDWARFIERHFLYRGQNKRDAGSPAPKPK